MAPVVTAITNKIYSPLVVCKKQYGALVHSQVDPYQSSCQSQAKNSFEFTNCGNIDPQESPIQLPVTNYSAEVLQKYTNLILEGMQATRAN